MDVHHPVSANTRGERPPPTRTVDYHNWLRFAIRLRSDSSKTLAAYRLWVGKFQAFVRSRLAAELGTREVRGFLSSFAVQREVSASTQNQAFNPQG